MRFIKLLGFIFAFFGFSALSLSANANACKGEVSELNVLIQGHPAMVHMEKHKADFEAMMGLKVNVTTLGEQEPQRSHIALQRFFGGGESGANAMHKSVLKVSRREHLSVVGCWMDEKP